MEALREEKGLAHGMLGFPWGGTRSGLGALGRVYEAVARQMFRAFSR